MKYLYSVFIVLCLLLCLVPSVGMLFFPTTQTAENRPMAAAPQLIKDGKPNLQFTEDLESWFDQHIALRNQLVCADGYIQTKVFLTSSTDSVLCGSDGWLYYSSTLADYRGAALLTERERFALANNFAVVQRYLQQREIAFTLTIAPNKNTLYPENMPYYAGLPVSTDRNAKLLQPLLQQQGVCYTDLFALFEGQEEVLYLRRDSHWNNKGAYMAYTALMESLGLQSRTYEPAAVKAENGDLNRMVYSFYGPREEDPDYGLPAYDGEKGWLVTENPKGTGTLLMFRDSFANNLIPFFSGDFATAAYSKGEPNALERYVETQAPTAVIIQKVERNLTDYLTEPPILTAPTEELPLAYTITKPAATVQAAESEHDPNYLRITGTVEKDRLQEAAAVCVSVDGTLYRAYLTGENSFLLYLKKALVSDGAPVRVYAMGDTCLQVLSTTLGN